MKKMRIFTLFILCGIIFGCNTSEDIRIEFLDKGFGSPVKRASEERVVKILVDFNVSLDLEFRNSIREDFINHPDLSFVFWKNCSVKGNNEVWYINYISLTELTHIVDSLGYVNVFTELQVQDTNNIPNDDYIFRLHYDSECPSIF